MCGILGISGISLESYDDAALARMLGTLAKRGPDDKGIVQFDQCILAQTRLSIIDLSGGHQPMRDNKAPLTITFNGEIYNYRELRTELTAKGHVFSTNSDTEVILKAYQEYGEDCPIHLEGMFAFAIWDEAKQRLFLARDRFGKKPLYYAHDEHGALIFASEIKAIFESGMVKGVLDPSALDDYLTLMYIPPWRTVYKNVHTLPPASQATVDSGKLSISRYWQLEKRTKKIPTYEEARETVRTLLTAAVKKRMIADVEIGSFLSGGVDSTLVTHIAQSFSKAPIKTFSVGYQDYINELPFALEASKKIGTDHYPLQAKDDAIHELRSTIAYFDEPHADSSDFPQFLVSRLAASKVKVALSGDGADELFLGYGWYTRHKNLSYRKNFVEKMFQNPLSGYLQMVCVFSPSERKQLWKVASSCASKISILNSQVKDSKLSSAEKINMFDLTTYLPGLLLVKADRAGMMNSLEIRSPFLDHKLAEYVYNLPEEYKTNNVMYKRILKDLLGEVMPKEFVHRRKQGFGAPVKKWLRAGGFKAEVRKTLGNPQAEVFSFLNKLFVDQMLHHFFDEGRDEYNYKIWVLYCLEIWLQSHKKYHVAE
ncbi:MAG: asparagine synthase (glutamine-hydrolyzing) [bacterium]